MPKEGLWSSFSGLEQSLPPCWLPVSVDDHGGGVWRFLGQRSRGWRGRRLLWKEEEEAETLCSVLSRSLRPCCPDLGRSPLAGLHAQLLPVGRLLCFGLRAGVGAPVERRHGSAFGVGVLSAVGRLVADLVLSGALHLFQGADWRRERTVSHGSRARGREHGGALTYLAAPAVRSAASGRRCPAGACGFSVSYTGCTLWLCLRSELEMPVGETVRKTYLLTEKQNTKDWYHLILSIFLKKSPSSRVKHSTIVSSLCNLLLKKIFPYESEPFRRLCPVTWTGMKRFSVADVKTGSEISVSS